MVLKSVCLQGFKSFPDKTEIRFLDGMTAIVGPNGSGKSNIADAIRWVLGEQSSRSLRGAKMEDVIFGGTATRHAVGFAEVSLVLDNTDNRFPIEFTEVMITRRYYRSGESVYSINKRPCRLKDIHELLMDTGLGRDGYCMIGQGRIDEILSLKSEDRREVFEEAAGITKFRYRKEEAERKLQVAEENLMRLHDIYREILAQKEPLRLEAEKAEQYQTLAEELKTKELSLWLYVLEQSQKQEQTHEQTLTLCKQDLTNAQSEREQLLAQKNTCALQVQSLSVQIETLRQQKAQSEQIVSHLASTASALEAGITARLEHIARTKAEGTGHTKQVKHLQVQVEEKKAQCAELDKQCTALTQTVAQIQNEQATLQQATAQIRTQLDATTEALRQNEQARFALQMDQTSAKAQGEALQNRLASTQQAIAGCQTELEAHAQKLSMLTQEQEENAEAKIALQNRLSGVHKKVELRQQKKQALVDEQLQTQSHLQDTQNRIRMLTEMEQDLEGFSRSVQTVMAQHFAGVHGPVLSLIQTEARYALAIETALGAAGSHIVVDNTAVAKKAVYDLKARKAGRATFLPLDTIRPQSLRETGVDTQAGFCGIASHLVEAPEHYRAIVENLLGRTVIAQTFDHATAIAKHYGHRFRIVTLDGQVISAGGAITGGSAGKSTGFLERKNQIVKLKEQKQSLEQAQQTQKEHLQKLEQEIASLLFSVQAETEEGERIRAQSVRLLALVQGQTEMQRATESRLSNLQKECDTILAEQTLHAQTLTQKQTLLQSLQNEQNALEMKQKAQTQALATQTQKEQALGQTYQTVQTDLARIHAGAHAEKSNLENLMSLLQTAKENHLQGQTTVQTLQAEIDASRTGLMQNEQTRQTEQAKLETFGAELSRLIAQRLSSEQTRTQLDSQIERQSDRILELERQLAKLQAQSERLVSEKMSILHQMWESYQLTPNVCKQSYTPCANSVQTEAEIIALKTQIRTLGSVNLSALTQYEALCERYDFLTAQKEDLERAQADLQKVICRLTEQMKTTFRTEFAKLNTHFGQTFAQMFGGGHAELCLEDTNNVLTSGIEIKVCPPGKALKTITLLSGGEKAFVAIALYFAILKVRPTPFCVLDEIDAALDDSNVVRYAQYVQTLSAQTQFITITHRRGTMEASNILYGVTMQEQGVSKLLVLNLNEAEQTALQNN